jgi:NAD(P)-dependent dehydrogenase (short-subunit alcohol dehydrogenase family)
MTSPAELFSLKGKVAVVTGGAQGIGLMISRGLSQAGAKVYVVSRKKDTADAAAKELSASGEVVAFPADVSTVAEAERLAKEIGEKEGGKLHVLVNNAGAAWGAPFDAYPDSAWDKVLALNVKAVFHLARTCAPLLQKAAKPNDPGRIINVGSIDGFRVPALDNYAYSTSKAAVHHLTRVLAQRLADRNITANAIAPGPFPSKMMAATLKEKGDEFRGKCPLGRLGEPDDMAGIAVYLASRASGYVTGQIIAVDGGFSTAPWV